jgi:hypothetical protein
MLRARSLVVGLVVCGCNPDPVNHIADAGVDAPSCTPPTGAGTMHSGTINAETWTEAASPHLLPFDTGIYGALTIEPCAVVRIAGGKTVTVRPGGAFVAAGAPGRPVTVEQLTPGTPWAGIRTLGGDLSFTHAIIRGGGDPLNTSNILGFAIQISRSPSDTSGSLHMDDVEIADSASQGVYLSGAAGFDATSRDVRIHGSVGYPLHTYARVIGSIPTGTYTGNTHDEFVISDSGGAIVDDQTMHDRGIPYHVGIGLGMGQLDVVAPTGVAVLTIEPGVTIKFEAGGRMRVSPAVSTAPAQGALIAIGTVAKPIVFTSGAATPAAGDWLGMWLGGAVDSRTRIQHARVEYAGGTSVSGSNSCPYPGRPTQINDAAIRVVGTAPPPAQFITDTEIVSSALDGIDRGWRDDFQPDFLTSNTFTNVAGCKQTTPRTLAGVCAATPACP